MNSSFTLIALILFLNPGSIQEVSAVPALCDKPAAIHFSPGRSAGQVDGGIAPGTLACWTLSAQRDQVMSAKITSTGQNAVFQIYRPGWKVSQSDGDIVFTGTALSGATESDGASAWTGKLPESGQFLFVLGSIRGGSDYRLNVRITPGH